MHGQTACSVKQVIVFFFFDKPLFKSSLVIANPVQFDLLRGTIGSLTWYSGSHVYPSIGFKSTRTTLINQSHIMFLLELDWCKNEKANLRSYGDLMNINSKLCTFTSVYGIGIMFSVTVPLPPQKKKKM